MTRILGFRACESLDDNSGIFFPVCRVFLFDLIFSLCIDLLEGFVCLNEMEESAD